MGDYVLHKIRVKSGRPIIEIMGGVWVTPGNGKRGSEKGSIKTINF